MGFGPDPIVLNDIACIWKHRSSFWGCGPGPNVTLANRHSHLAEIAMTTTHRLVFTIFLASVPLASVRAADNPTREEIAKRAKAATVLVDVKPYGFGTGFCVHPSGLFVTNEHVALANAQSIHLVLNSGLKAQKVMKATAIRRDKARDLALLKVEEEGKFESLELGSDKDLGELAEMIAFGFPFGVALGQSGEYPAITVNLSSVTSLRRDKSGELERIQLDGALNPGHSGGPVIDRSGKLVGVVVSGIPGSGVHVAIPVTHLQVFLARPEVTITLPKITMANRHEQFEFTAKSVSVVPMKDPLDLELVLSAGPDKQRRMQMKLSDGLYRAKTTPFPKREGPLMCRVAVKYDDGMLVGLAEDRACRLGDMDVKLSQLKSVRLGSKPESILTNGQRIAGTPSGLDPLSLAVGKQSIRASIAEAMAVDIDALEDPTALSCMVVAKHTGREVEKYCLPLLIEGLSSSVMESLLEGKFIKPVPSGSPISSLQIASVKGDPIGQGKTYSFPGSDLHVSTTNRGVLVSSPGFGLGWTVQVGGPGNRFLDVGEYDDVRRYAFSGDAPGLQVTGNSIGSEKVFGKFVVWEVEVKREQIIRLAVDFIQRTEKTAPPLVGSLRINSSFH
jgi:Trypsin-like peptidase domain